MKPLSPMQDDIQETHDEQTPLNFIAEVLDEGDFPVVYQEAGEQSPVEQVFVPFEHEKEALSSSLQILFINDLVKTLGIDQEEEEDEVQLLQFFLLCPFQCTADTVREVALFILALNRILPVGAFGLSQKEGTIYFQYVLALEDQGDALDPDLILEVVSMINMFVLEFIENISLVAKGEKTSDALLKEMEEKGMALPPLGFPKEAEGQASATTQD